MAPLSGITDVPFRRLVRSFGTPIVFSEMVASGELVRGDAESFLRSQRAGDGVHAVQLAGREPKAMEEAARHLAGGGADHIDINMGCPAKKVVGGASGAALMRDLDLARRIVAATKRGAGSVPVSVKMRLGWDRSQLNAADIAKAASEEGAVRLTVHGRTRDQFYEGHADWSAIADVARATGLPVTANGDLTDPDQVPLMRARSGCQGLMVGRGACGRPWAPALLAGRASMVDLAQRDMADITTEHYDAMLTHYGPSVGVRHARKHLGWYLEGLARLVGELSSETAVLLRQSSSDEVFASLRRLFAGVSAAELESARIQRKAA
ncbi:tRNA-dihydrouridine synthase [Aureimonas sp. AU4]|uniref:tRNA dihydrouridine synthase n=1 Tax=Aureimonas sp. AU4 TaxID=1638163 RepID=UPI001FCCC3FD|nr:tRNA-dihydrouridine synthase [Aureimonas sp. AU4]